MGDGQRDTHPTLVEVSISVKSQVEVKVEGGPGVTRRDVYTDQRVSRSLHTSRINREDNDKVNILERKFKD